MTSQHGVNSNPPNQSPSMPQSDIRDSELHMALLAWRAGDITMIELKKVITNHTSAETLKALDKLEKLAIAYSQVIAAVYDGEPIEQAEPRIMADLAKLKGKPSIDRLAKYKPEKEAQE